MTAASRSLLAALLLLLPAAGPSAADPDRLSLLALGDTGHPPGVLPFLTGQQQVASALEQVDRSDPVDGLVLLGDNFYPDGLREREFKDRVRENLVSPYCHFLALTDRGRGSLSEACPVPEARRHPVPLFAVLGNHDYSENESPLLQTKRIPEYVPSWRMPRGQAELHELEGGVSLILLQSMPVVRGQKLGPLVKALRRSRGPWRIVAAHHPMVDAGRGYEPRYATWLGEAFRKAGVPVHLFLSGHLHNLQVFEMAAPAPVLHVASGAGSETRPVLPSEGTRRFALEALGFARIDVGGPDGDMSVILYRVGGAGLAPSELRPVSAWRVDREGQVRPAETSAIGTTGGATGVQPVLAAEPDTPD